VRILLLSLLRLQIYHCVTLSTAKRWGFLSYTSSLFPTINKLVRLPATSVINSTCSSQLTILHLPLEPFTARSEARYWLRIAISAYPTRIRRPRYGACRRNIAMPFAILASRQGFGELKTEQLGGHSHEQQRHRQAPIDDDGLLWKN